MKFQFLCILILTAFTSLQAQDLYYCGNDEKPKLNYDEAAYLNDYLKEKIGNFDFDGKKIVFFTGFTANKTGSKVKFFDLVKEWSVHNKKIPVIFVEFSPEEKKKTGIDGIIAYNTISISKKKKQKIIQML